MKLPLTFVYNSGDDNNMKERRRKKNACYFINFDVNFACLVFYIIVVNLPGPIENENGFFLYLIKLAPG